MTKKKVQKQPNPTWGKMLTRQELLALLARLDAKKKDREMSKLSDSIAKALAKKQGRTHVDGSEVNATVEKKAKIKPSAGPAKKFSLSCSTGIFFSGFFVITFINSSHIVHKARWIRCSWWKRYNIHLSP